MYGLSIAFSLPFINPMMETSEDKSVCESKMDTHSP